MRNLWKTALVVAALASTPALAQQAASTGGNDDLIWNLFGLLGLVGLRGLWRASDNDGYTDDPV